MLVPNLNVAKCSETSVIFVRLRMLSYLVLSIVNRLSGLSRPAEARVSHVFKLFPAKI